MRPKHLLVPLLAVLAAGCGSEVEMIRGDDAPSVTVPGGAVYENGGADGSGADGSESRQDRGGIGAGPDTPEPGDSPGADTQFKPPRGTPSGR